MGRESSVVEVDGIEYAVRFNGFHEPMYTWATDGTDVHLRPWTCGEHLRLLGRHVLPGSQGGALDSRGYARDMLEALDVPEHLADEMSPLALWWAAADGEQARHQVGAHGWLELESVRVRLAPWTHGARLGAMAHSISAESDGTLYFNVETYLKAMLKASVVEVDPAKCEILELDSDSAAALIDAVVGFNVPDSSIENQIAEAFQAGIQQMAANTLRLCRALGWTPSQVWATPAPEVDTLLSLLDIVAGKTPQAQSQPQFQGLAAHPDAVVIQIKDA